MSQYSSFHFLYLTLSLLFLHPSHFTLFPVFCNPRSQAERPNVPQTPPHSPGPQYWVCDQLDKCWLLLIVQKAHVAPPWKLWGRWGDDPPQTPALRGSRVATRGFRVRDLVVWCFFEVFAPRVPRVKCIVAFYAEVSWCYKGSHAADRGRCGRDLVTFYVFYTGLQRLSLLLNMWRPCL